jgi:release factor H-coupled RctB family protein
MKTLIESNVRVITSAKGWIEGEAVRQLYAAAQLDGVRRAVGFPDLHPGRCGPVGAAFVTESVIYPHLIGGDIGCGMALFQTDLLRRKARLDRWAELRFDLEQLWEGDVCERLRSGDLCATQFAESFGTLGGGNHFAELQAVEKIFDHVAFDALGLVKEELLLLVHSGSRGLGQSLLGTYIEEHGARGADADSDAATGYLLCHYHAVRWAKANRALIAQRFLDTVGASGKRVLDACHNSITITSPSPVGGERAGVRDESGTPLYVHRKGAAPADKGPVVIAGSRGSMSYLVQPLNAGLESAWSLAHGAGRKWSRSAARVRTRERFRVDELAQTPLGGRVVCEDRDLLYEESPLAYKNIEAVVEDLIDAGLVEVVATLRPLLTYKTRVIRR